MELNESENALEESPFITVEIYLIVTSKYDHSAFCCAYLPSGKLSNSNRQFDSGPFTNDFHGFFQPPEGEQIGAQETYSHDH